MDYKNFLNRFLTSILFIILYFVIIIYFTDKIIYLVTLIYLLIIIEILVNFKRYTYLPIIYILISCTFFIIYFNSYFNLFEFTFIIICISLFDSSSYLIGKNLGKKRIFFKISPNKTYEGLFGGVIITNLSSVFVYFYFDYDFQINMSLFYLTNIIIFFSFFGDLMQSYFKRLNNLKDSSNFIPGHGGFFDRFDSFLLVIVPLTIHKLFI